MNAPSTQRAGITVHVNDQSHALPTGTTVAGLLERLQLAGRAGVAVAIAGAVVPRREWAGHVLVDGERVLVIRATQGG